jgi:hypothetical protein
VGYPASSPARLNIARPSETGSLPDPRSRQQVHP